MNKKCRCELVECLGSGKCVCCLKTRIKNSAVDDKFTALLFYPRLRYGNRFK